MISGRAAAERREPKQAAAEEQERGRLWHCRRCGLNFDRYKNVADIWAKQTLVADCQLGRRSQRDILYFCCHLKLCEWEVCRKGAKADINRIGPADSRITGYV